jgi:5-formyltetrahydrofolate cyclo-ligase
MACQPGAALREAKQVLRTGVLAARDALPEAVRNAASRAIAARLLARPEYAAAHSVLLTLPFRSEWNAVEIVTAALAAGKRVVLPRVDVAQRVLVLHEIADVARDVAPGYRGIPEPRVEAPRADAATMDFVLVPGVAFDAAGRRLGYGGGFYDRLLPQLPRQAPRVAAAFDLQLVDHVPAGAHDARVDLIVTPTRTLHAAAPA